MTREKSIWTIEDTAEYLIGPLLAFIRESIMSLYFMQFSTSAKFKHLF